MNLFQITSPTGSVVPAIVQLVLIVLVTQGIKSLYQALTGNVIMGNIAAYAYIIVGLVVFALNYFLPLLPPNVTQTLTDFLTALGVLISGSGLYSMTAALRVPANAVVVTSTETVPPTPVK